MPKPDARVEPRRSAVTALNAICPYFTMFPLEFPSEILRRHAHAGDWVLDPFCGRGTTNYASRLLGLPSLGIDSSPVAVAISKAKLATVAPAAILATAQRLLDEVTVPRDVPRGEFWEWAFHPDVLQTLCRLREGLLADCRSQARQALRAILMGALHGPRPRARQAYFSNQSPRTYAPKPRYAVSFWREHDLRPERVDVMGIITARAHRYYDSPGLRARGRILLGDSRESRICDRLHPDAPVRWVITSPPYYGLRTYLPDQWLRLWLLGGPANVEYSTHRQLSHASPDEFTAQLHDVWCNVGALCGRGARMVVRFGAIHDRKVEPLILLRNSLADTGWQIRTIRGAGSAAAGRRQALHFAGTHHRAIEEHDVWAVWQGGG